MMPSALADVILRWPREAVVEILIRMRTVDLAFVAKEVKEELELRAEAREKEMKAKG